MDRDAFSPSTQIHAACAGGEHAGAVRTAKTNRSNCGNDMALNLIVSLDSKRGFPRLCATGLFERLDSWSDAIFVVYNAAPPIYGRMPTGLPRA